jgi:uncharacterized protein YjbJ (UPF0337 family)
MFFMVCSLWKAVLRKAVRQLVQTLRPRYSSNNLRVQATAPCQKTHGGTWRRPVEYSKQRPAARAMPTFMELRCRFAGCATINNQLTRRRKMIDKDRIKGSAEQAKGKVKEWTGKALGDKKTEAEGKADQVKGKVQNAVGGVKDAIRGK